MSREGLLSQNVNVEVKHKINSKNKWTLQNTRQCQLFGIKTTEYVDRKNVKKKNEITLEKFSMFTAYAREEPVTWSLQA